MTSQECTNAGLVICLVTMGINRVLGERNLAKLNAEEKSLLVDKFRALRLYPSLISIGLVIVVLLFASSFKEYAREAMFVIMGLMAALIGVTLVLGRAKINSLPINPEYKKMYIIQQAINLVGIAIGFGLVMFGIMTK